MKAKVFFLFTLLVLTFLQPVTIEAKKPAYCDDALKKCNDWCKNFYIDPLGQYGCEMGCMIGYLNCGTQN